MKGMLYSNILKYFCYLKLNHSNNKNYKKLNRLKYKIINYKMDYNNFMNQISLLMELNKTFIHNQRKCWVQ